MQFDKDFSCRCRFLTLQLPFHFSMLGLHIYDTTSNLTCSNFRMDFYFSLVSQHSQLIERPPELILRRGAIIPRESSVSWGNKISLRYFEYH